MVDEEGKHEVSSLLNNFVWISRHTADVMIADRKMVVLALPRPRFGNVYFSQYMLVVLLCERSTK